MSRKKKNEQRKMDRHFPKEDIQITIGTLKILSIINHEENATQSHSELPHT